MAEFIDPALVPKVTLPSGEKVPCVGMGTFGSDRVSAEEVSEAVAGAVRCGYRMFDCAACYGNEPQIGKVFQEAFEEGVVERKDLFIMTKVWNDMHRDVEKACRKSIQDLQCDYVDLYFIPWPFPNYHAPGCDVDSRKSRFQTFQCRRRVYGYLPSVRGTGGKRSDPLYQNIQYDNSETGGSTSSYED